jgi:tRNA pseudouridine38-40 synthase
MRYALGVEYDGSDFRGWQNLGEGGPSVQASLEQALSSVADTPLQVVCAGRTDAGVHGINQVIHFDTEVERELFSWVRGSNRYLPPDIAIQWCRFPGDAFHARNSARGRRYAYLLLESAVRPAIESGQCGWVFRPLDQALLEAAAERLIGEHDFSSFRSSECQAASPVKTLREVRVQRRGAYWRFEFEASAFLHHMVRNLMGCLLAVGTGARSADWVSEVLAARDRKVAAPTFAPDGLYFLGPTYDAELDIPREVAALNWLP